MAQDNLRVLIVDDSAVMRTLMSDQVAAAPGLTVAGVARNGPEALALAAELQPDVITLDVQMPEMNGMAVLDTLLRRRPIPVVMVSALTRAGTAIALDALERGATDCVAKPTHGVSDMAAFAAELIEKIRAAAGVDVRHAIALRNRPVIQRRKSAGVRPTVKAAIGDCPAALAAQCIALGVSTGGPSALASLLESLRPPMPPIVIVQHMPAQFTGPLAARLDAISALNVCEAAQGDRLLPNCVLIAPGGRHLELRNYGSLAGVVVRDGPPVSSHKPSVDVMMKSAAEVFGPNCLGVIMTGMGRDGADGCRAIRAAGGYVLGQDQATSDVYGMNRTAYVEGNVDEQFGLPLAASAITRHVRRRKAVAACGCYDHATAPLAVQHP